MQRGPSQFGSRRNSSRGSDAELLGDYRSSGTGNEDEDGSTTTGLLDQESGRKGSGKEPSSSPNDEESNDKTKENDNFAPPALASARTAGMLLIADIVGSGILGLGYAFVKLGWVLAVISGIIWFPLNIYAGLLLFEVKLQHRNAHTFADIAGAVMHSKVAKYIVGFVVYLYILTTLSNYLLIMAESLQNVFVLTLPESCKYWFSLVSVALLIPIVQFRTLNATKLLLIVNILALFIAIFTALGTLFAMGVDESLASRNATTQVVATNITLSSFFEAQSMFAFAYSGTILYLEIMSEMKDVREFPKSLACYGGPFQVVSYLFTGSMTYLFLGTSATGLLTSMIPIGGTYIASNLFLFIHIWIAFVIKAIVISRAMHKAVSSSTVNDFTICGKGAGIWFGITFLILSFCFILANAIPIFSDLTVLLGALLSPWCGFFFPIMFSLKMRHELGKQTPILEILLIVFLLIFNALLFFSGTYGAILSIIDSDSNGAGPFDCLTVQDNSH